LGVLSLGFFIAGLSIGGMILLSLVECNIFRFPKLGKKKLSSIFQDPADQKANLKLSPLTFNRRTLQESKISDHQAGRYMKIMNPNIFFGRLKTAYQ
jgi:hypothetical protein